MKISTERKLRIYYEGSIYGIYNTRPGGISNFFDHLISRISTREECLLTSKRPSNLPHPSGKYLQIARYDHHIRPNRFNQYVERKSFSLRTRLFSPSLIHYTYYIDPCLWHLHLPLVCTAFDMIHEKWSNQLDPNENHRLLKLRCFDKAAAIPCISESTRNDLLELYPHLESKTSVIYLAGDLKSIPSFISSRCTDVCSKSYLLYVGTRKSYKNFTRLLLAFARIATNCNWIKLKVVGAPFDEHETDLIDALGVENRVEVLPNIADGDLYSLYSSAFAFVYPSLYEGFGIPLLEAMQLNCPVIAADSSSIPEVTGNAAILFNPYSIDSIYGAIMQLVARPGLREELIEKGRHRVKQFSWDNTANQYLKLYKNVILSYPNY